jgi:hypothetical protein
MSCGGDDDDDGGTRDNPTTSADPAGTIAANLTHQGGSVYFSGFTDPYCSIKMNSSNNLETSSCEIASVGSVKGLSSITKVPETGWSHETAAIPGYGYVIKDRQGKSTWNEVTRQYEDEYWDEYARLYVVDYMESTTGGIMGCTIKYQIWTPTIK